MARATRRLLAALAVLVCLLQPGSAQQKNGLILHGSLEQDSSLRQYGDYSLRYAGSSLFNLSFRNANDEFARLDGSLDFSLLQGENAEQAAGRTRSLLESAFSGLATQPDYSILSAALAGQNSFQASVKKLYLSLYFEAADFSAGRQIISFGRGAVFSPVNAFSPVDLSDLNYARGGSDVIRLKTAFGESSGLDAATSLSARMDSTVSALRLYGNLAGCDLSAVGMYRSSREEWLLGGDFKFDLELGFHGEVLAHLDRRRGKAWPEAMAGADYSIEQTWFFNLEYLYNGDPLGPSGISLAEIAESGRIFLNSQYVFGAIQWKPNDLATVSSNILWNPIDAAAIASVQFGYNLFQNADLLVYLRWYEKNINNLDLATLGRQFPWEYGVKLSVKY
jgi:hypothetical protein